MKNCTLHNITVTVLCLILTAILSDHTAYGNERQHHTGKIRFEIKSTGAGYIARTADTTFTRGRSLFDIVSFLPEIMFQDNTFSINGAKAAGIYLNGEKIRQTEMLKSISGSTVSHIEVTYAASGDSSADSDGGKVRIYTYPLRKDTPQLTGITSLGASARPTDGFGDLSFMSFLDYRKGKNIITNHLTYTEYLNRNKSEEDKTPTKGTDQAIDTDISTKETIREIDENITFSHNINDKHNISIDAGFKYRLDAPVTRSIYKTEGAEESTSTTSNKVSGYEYKASAAYITSILPKNTETILSVSYTGKDERRDNSYISTSHSGDKNSIHTDVIENVLSFNIPVNKSLNITTGAEFDVTLSRYRLLESYGTPAFDDNVSSAITRGYTSRIYALFYGKKCKLGYRIGINLQSNTISYKDMTYRQEARNTQFGASPTLKLYYPLDKDERFTAVLTYRHLLGAIPYRAISPYKYWSDEYNYVVGNTALKSPQSDLVMLIFTMFSSRLNIGISYRYDKDRIHFQTTEDPEMENVLYTKPINLSDSHTATMNIDANIGISDIIKTKLLLNGELIKENSTINGIHYRNLRQRARISLYNSINFGYGISMELNGSWQPAYTLYDHKYSDTYTIYGTLSKNLLSDQLRIAIDFIAYHKAPVITTTTDQNTIIAKDFSDRQRIGISASWIF